MHAESVCPDYAAPRLCRKAVPGRERRFCAIRYVESPEPIREGSKVESSIGEGSRGEKRKDNAEALLR